MARKLSPDPDHVHCEHVAALEADLAALKRKLASRDPLAGIDAPVKRSGASDSFLDQLAPQDRKFMERKMGKGGKS